MLVQGDAFFAFVAAGFIEPWLPESAEQNRIVTRAAGAATGELCRAYDTIYDGVLGPWFLPTFVDAGELDELDYAVLLPDVGACVDRIRVRQGHSFTDEAAGMHMHRSFTDAEIPARHLIDSTELDPSETVERILEARSDGALRIA